MIDSISTELNIVDTAGSDINSGLVDAVQSVDSPDVKISAKVSVDAGELRSVLTKLSIFKDLPSDEFTEQIKDDLLRLGFSYDAAKDASKKPYVNFIATNEGLSLEKHIGNIAIRVSVNGACVNKSGVFAVRLDHLQEFTAPLKGNIVVEKETKGFCFVKQGKFKLTLYQSYTPTLFAAANDAETSSLKIKYSCFKKLSARLATVYRFCDKDSRWDKTHSYNVIQNVDGELKFAAISNSAVVISTVGDKLLFDVEKDFKCVMPLQMLSLAASLPIDDSETVTIKAGVNETAFEYSSGSLVEKREHWCDIKKVVERYNDILNGKYSATAESKAIVPADELLNSISGLSAGLRFDAKQSKMLTIEETLLRDDWGNITEDTGLKIRMSDGKTENTTQLNAAFAGHFGDFSCGFNELVAVLKNIVAEFKKDNPKHSCVKRRRRGRLCGNDTPKETKTQPLITLQVGVLSYTLVIKKAELSDIEFILGGYTDEYRIYREMLDAQYWCNVKPDAFDACVEQMEKDAAFYICNNSPSFVDSVLGAEYTPTEEEINDVITNSLFDKERSKKGLPPIASREEAIATLKKQKAFEIITKENTHSTVDAAQAVDSSNAAPVEDSTPTEPTAVDAPDANEQPIIDTRAAVKAAVISDKVITPPTVDVPFAVVAAKNIASVIVQSDSQIIIAQNNTKVLSFADLNFSIGDTDVDRLLSFVDGRTRLISAVNAQWVNKYVPIIKHDGTINQKLLVEQYKLAHYVSTLFEGGKGKDRDVMRIYNEYETCLNRVFGYLADILRIYGRDRDANIITREGTIARVNGCISATNDRQTPGKTRALRNAFYKNKLVVPLRYKFYKKAKWNGEDIVEPCTEDERGAVPVGCILQDENLVTPDAFDYMVEQLEKDAADPRVDIVIDRFDDDDPDDSPSFNVMPVDAPDNDDELVDAATSPIVDTKEIDKMFTPTPQLLLPAPKIATLFLPAPSVNINSDSADACDNTPNKIDTAATVNALKTQAAEARIALELADFKARLDRITNNFNIGIAALDEFQTFAPRSHKGAIVKPKRQRLTGRRRKKTNAEQLKSLATPLIKQIAAISAEFQRDNTASNTLDGSNSTPSTVETVDDAAKHVDASNGAAGFKSALAFDSIVQSIKFGLIAALTVFAHFNPSPAVTDIALALASVFTVELVIKFCWLFAALSKVEELKEGDVGEVAPPEVKRLKTRSHNPLARA